MSENFKLCVCCSLPATYQCSRCLDHYCSSECQKKDWIRHKQICIYMPTLIMAAGESEKPTLPTTPIRKDQSSGSNWVEIDEKPAEIAKPTLTKIVALVEQPNIAQQQPKPDVAAEVVPNKTTGPAHEEKSSPKPDGPAHEEKSSPKPEPIVSQKKEQVPLKVPMGGLRSMKFPIKPIQTPKVAEPIKPLMISDLKRRVWPNTKNVKTKIIATLEYNVFTLHEANKDIEDYYGHIQTEINKMCEDLGTTDYQPVLGEVIFAPFEGDWYRAEVLDLDPKEGTIIQYIDYGNMVTVKRGEMHPTNGKARFDICAENFLITNMPKPEDWNDKQKEIFMSGYVTIANIQKGSEGSMQCEIFGF